MSPEAVPPSISIRLLQLFVDTANQEVGAEKLPLILSGVLLSPSVIEMDMVLSLDGMRAAEIYALVQQSLRLFYGRGARGILLRIGQGMWEHHVAQADFREKAELEIARRLPVPARRRHILDLVAALLREGGGEISVHTLDLDFLLVDHASASAFGQSSSEPICLVTLGMLQQALSWATGLEPDIEEITCKAMGAPTCEFKIKPGGK